jgi:putative ribosome biogenesis GTPase RsgA
MANVLSSSNPHRESGSSIERLHQQAIRLTEFELPSSRIVGLVGDSGVGKSSLINSLLDKMELARAVSDGLQSSEPPD